MSLEIGHLALTSGIGLSGCRGIKGAQLPLDFRSAGRGFESLPAHRQFSLDRNQVLLYTTSDTLTVQVISPCRLPHKLSTGYG